MATVSNYNIHQVTNYDLTEDMAKTEYRLPFPIREEEDGQYVLNTTEENVTYYEILKNANIIKFSYICEPKGHIYPIFLQVNGSYKEFQIGRNGIYEMQPETLVEDGEAVTTDIVITGVRVPAGIEFKIDYVVPIN